MRDKGTLHRKVVDGCLAQSPLPALDALPLCAMFLGHDVSPGDGFVGENLSPRDTSLCLFY
jgi:hypothetical protein